MRLYIALSVLFVIGEIVACIWLLRWLAGGYLGIAATAVICSVCVAFFAFCLAAIRVASKADDASDDWGKLHIDDD